MDKKVCDCETKQLGYPIDEVDNATQIGEELYRIWQEFSYPDKLWTVGCSWSTSLDENGSRPMPLKITALCGTGGALSEATEEFKSKLLDRDWRNRPEEPPDDHSCDLV